MRSLVALLLVTAALAGCATDNGTGDPPATGTRDPASGAGGTPPTSITAPNPLAKKPVNNSTTPTPTATPTTTPTPSPTPTVTPTETPPSEPIDVAIVGFAYSPANVNAAIGQSVVWTNGDSAPHTVTFDDVDSGTLREGETFSHAFDVAGTYDYVCAFHSSMRGSVTVG